MINTIDVVLAIFGAMLFSSGLSGRINPDNFPDLIKGKATSSPIIPGLDNWNGTVPGLIFAGAVLIIFEIPISSNIFKNVKKYVKPFFIGGLIFAIGASNLSVQTKKKSSDDSED